MAAYEIIWEEALQELKGVLPDFHFKTFFFSRKPFFEDRGTYYFEVGSANEQELMQKKYASKVQTALVNAIQTISGKPQKVDVVYMTPAQAEDFRVSFGAHNDAGKAAQNLKEPENEEPAEAPAVSPPAKKDTAPRRTVSAAPAAVPAAGDAQKIDPAYTFDSFVVGDSNNFANAAARAVADSPGRVYNPLFLYGDVGLGKTHLMHAIGNEILLTRPDARIVYVTTETFTNELIHMIHHSGPSGDRRSEFQNKYRRADVLMIDDIQFIAGKDQTQIEFFHTFNALHSDDKQIVISSDRPPVELTQLEERMRSRFEMGLVVKIEPPDYETRVAILMKKAEERPDMLPVDEDVFHYIAEQPNANIRSLEGALTRLSMYASLHESRRIDMATAKNALQDFFRVKIERIITPDQVCRAVCEYYEVTENDLKGPKRTKNIAFARQVAMFVLRKMTDMSLSQIASQFGKKDHTTVMYAEKSVTKSMEENANVKKAVNDIMAHLKSS